jgi:hypothetical protein
LFFAEKRVGDVAAVQLTDGKEGDVEKVLALLVTHAAHA